MKSRTLFLALLSTIAIIIAASLLAQAQRARVFVSVNGNDANPCTAGSPCKTFQAAHDAVLAGGEISVLDTGGYGTLVVTKAVSIVAVGVEAGIAIPSGGTGITIIAGTSDVINLSGLIIDGAGIGDTGLVFSVGRALTITNCVFRNHTQDGILLFPSPTSNPSVSVSNTLISNNNRYGMEIVTTGGNSIKVTLSNVEVANNSAFGGILLSGQNAGSVVSATVADSRIVSNGNFGIQANSVGGAANLMVTRSVIAYNFNNSHGYLGEGIRADGTNTTVRIGQSAITGNSRSWLVASTANLVSYGDNDINGNADGDPTPTSIAKK